MNNLADRNPEVVKQPSERLLHWQASLPEGPVDPDAGKSIWPWPQ
ncbi:MAG: hypothetical protein ACUVXB_13080 [Bryobacteraceae bacterium]